jgi:phage terminase large subunit-like protein
MVEGESGLLAICPKDERPLYKKSDRQLQWPNGAISLIFTADEPERLRGKQHMKLWGDEYASWRYKEAWDQASLGLRLGQKPQAVITTTPKPTKELRGLMASPSTFVTRGSTYDNRQNLAGAFLTQIVSRYEGTRLGRQELNAEILDDNPGALWRRDWIEEQRIARGPPMKRIVVSIDPTATSNPDSDEAGITVEGRGTDDRGYVLADLSMRGTPREWATVAVNAYHEWKADRIIGETNNGGEMIEAVIRMVDKNVAYRGVHASRGKITRAEPVSALYEQGRVSHVGFFPVLEDQMCDYDPKTAKYSPDRMDSLVFGITDLLIDGPGTAQVAPLRL